MMHFHDTEIEKPSPNSGDTTVSWLSSSGLLSVDQWPSDINDVITGAYGRLVTSGQFVSPPYSAISRAAGTASQAAVTNRPSAEDVAFENHREKLIAAVTSMKESSPDWYALGTKVSEESALTAEKFLRCLPTRVVLPKVAADGEGDIMFVWEDAGVSCIVTVEPKMLHLVSNPGSRAARQIDEQRFLGVQIPPTILRHIPRSK